MAINTNVVVLEGHMTKNPSITVVGDNKKKCEFTLGVNHGKNSKGEERSSFFQIQCWGSMAEFISNFGEKGAHLNVTGELVAESWKKEDGTYGNKVYVRANSVRLLDKKSDNASGPADTAAENSVEVDGETITYPWPSEEDPF